MEMTTDYHETHRPFSAKSSSATFCHEHDLAFCLANLERFKGTETKPTGCAYVSILIAGGAIPLSSCGSFQLREPGFLPGGQA